MRVLATFAHLLIEELFGIFLKLRQTVMAAEKIVLSVVIELPPQRCWRLLSCRKQDQSNLLYSNLPSLGRLLLGKTHRRKLCYTVGHQKLPPYIAGRSVLFN